MPYSSCGGVQVLKSRKVITDDKMTVHLFGKADSPCITAWALKRTAIDNRTEFGNDACKVVPKNFCVDDCRIIQFLWKSNFCPTKFVSNVKEVLYAIQAEERTVKSLDLDELPVERALL